MQTSNGRGSLKGPGPGRPKGYKSKRTLLKNLLEDDETMANHPTIQRAAARLGLDPAIDSPQKILTWVWMDFALTDKAVCIDAMNRLYGKPKETVELSGDAPKSIQIVFEKVQQENAREIEQ